MSFDEIAHKIREKLHGGKEYAKSHKDLMSYVSLFIAFWLFLVAVAFLI